MGEWTNPFHFTLQDLMPVIVKVTSGKQHKYAEKIMVNYIGSHLIVDKILF